jgi:enduracididine biosynthesis enzyme MppP
MELHNLTELEILALSAEVNVADGHPRQRLTESQRAIVGKFPELFALAAGVPFEALETRAQRSYMDAVQQAAAPVGSGRIFSGYASSVCIDAVARCLSESAPRVGLIHPTFDNIPDLLKAWSVQLVPVDEDQMDASGIERAGGGDLDAVFVTTPNNPTGRVVGEAALADIAQYCAARDMVLVIDTSFRGFDVRAQYDTYELLDATGVDYAVIEDTGKLWPASELKLGMVATSERTRLQLERAMTDILLSVSPFVCLFVDALARDAADGGFEQLHRLVADNRERVRNGLRDAPNASVVETDTRVSVERIKLADGVSAALLWEQLRSRGVHVLPCGQFHWARPGDGDCFIRIALGREPEMIERAIAEIRHSLETAPELAMQSTA